MENNIYKRLKKHINSKPSRSHYNKFYDSSKNYNNMLNELLDNNSIDNAKKVMISELDIKINNSPNESYKEIEKNKVIKNTEPKKEFKIELKDSIIKFLQKNLENIKSSNDLSVKTKELLPKTKKALNLTSITPSNNRFKTLNINNNKHKERPNNFMKINRKTTKTKTLKINESIKKNEILIKKIKAKNFHSFINKFSYTTNKKTKTNNPIFSQAHKSLLATVNKKHKNILSNYDNRKSTYSNMKFKKNKSFIKDNFNKTNTLRNSYKNSFVNNNFTLKYRKILHSNSKPKEKKIKLNNKFAFLSKTKYAKTESNYNTTKNLVLKKNDININKFLKKKNVPIKYRNLTLKEINILNNFNFTKNNFSSFFNSTFTKEKDKNCSTITNEKQKLKSQINKKLKINAKKTNKNLLNKNPINIVNININKNNNYIMNINNSENSNLNVIEKKKNKAYSKNEAKMKKFCSFQNFLSLSDKYKKNILKRFLSKGKNIINKDIKVVPFVGKY